MSVKYCLIQLSSCIFSLKNKETRGEVDCSLRIGPVNGGGGFGAEKGRGPLFPLPSGRLANLTLVLLR